VIGAIDIAPQYLIFAGAALLSLIAFVGLILVPALGSVGRAWEKLGVSFLALFVLATLVLAGIALGLVIILNWNDISDLFS
jgi:hypothetical protein